MKRLSILSALLLAWGVSGGANADDKVRGGLIGYQEVPAVSTVATGQFEADIHRDEQAFDYALTFEGLQGQVRQAHIHFAQRAVAGPIVIWLCGSETNPGPAGTQRCPQSGTVTGTVTAANVLAGQAGQQLAAGEIGEIIAAMRAGAAYANVHTDLSPSGEIRGQLRGNRRD